MKDLAVRAWLLAALAAGLCWMAACSVGWRRSDRVEPGPLPVRQQAQVWVAGKAHQVHAVMITADSVSGIPFMRHIECDSCRIAWPRAQVDSIRLGNSMDSFWKTGLLVGLPVGFVLLVLFTMPQT